VATNLCYGNPAAAFLQDYKMNRMLGGCIYWIVLGRTKRSLNAELEMREHYLFHDLMIAVPVVLMIVFFFIWAFQNL
jgi:hypothetical protein